jgi:uncharacterized protein (TIGR02246 family)
MSSDAEAIRAIVQSQADAWTRGDAEGYAASAGDDFSFTNIRGQRWIGRARFVSIHEGILKGVYSGSQLEADVEQVTFPGSDVAVAEILLRLSGARGMPAGVIADNDGVLRTRLLEIFERREGVWTLITCHNTPVIA